MANRFVAGGHVQAQDNYLYLSREADRKILDVCRAGGLAYVLNTRQVGKSSLMIRAAETLIEEGAAVAIVDLTEIGANLTVDQWYRGILVSIAGQLGLPFDAAAWWDSNSQLGPTHRFSLFFRDVALEHCKSNRIVVFIDEIDTTLSLPFRGPATDDFFAALRALHLGRAKDPELKRLSVVLLGVATPSDLILDPDRTPFNIGERIELGDFTEAEAQALLPESGIPAEYSSAVLKQVLLWTGGHPYLTLRFFRSLREDPPSAWTPAGIDGRIRLLFFGSTSEADSNLRFVRDMLLERYQGKGKVLEGYLAVIQGKRVQDQDNRPDIEWLKLSGIVRASGGLLECRNRLYAETFTARWAKEQLPATYWRNKLRKQLIVMLQTAFIVFVALALVYGYFSVLSARVDLSAAKQALSELDKARLEALAQQEKTAELARGRQSEAEGKLRALQELREKIERQAGETSASYSGALAKYLAEISREQGRLAFPLFLESVILKPTVAGSSGLMDQVSRALRRGRSPIHRGPVYAVAFSRDGETLATASGDKTVRIWNARSVPIPRATLVHQDVVNSVAFSPNSKTVATASQDGIVKLWDASSGRPLTVLAQGDAVLSVTFSPTGETVATAHWDKKARLWDTASGRLRIELAHQGLVRCVTFSPDGSLVATASFDGTAQLWDAASGQPLATLTRGDIVTAVAFSPDGKTIATTSYDNKARLWDTASAQLRITLAHDGLVRTVAFSPDAKTVGTASYDRTARLWDATSGQPLATLRYEDLVRDVTFSPTQPWFVVAVGNDFEFYPYGPNALIASACALLPANLTKEQWALYLPDEPYRKTCPNLKD